MLKDVESNFSELENKIVILQRNFKRISEDYKILSEDYQVLKNKYEEEKKNNRILAEENKNTKLHSAIAGNPEHNRLMKNHINRLIKEVDFCIAQIQNNGL
ncbi:MAG: hypothetical protein CSA38_04495 [Flavobacteriales bacterium]|nr:MAG: hypothetical protein CSA38_04495 [Flavobacteriales bacterium]